MEITKRRVPKCTWPSRTKSADANEPLEVRGCDLALGKCFAKPRFLYDAHGKRDNFGLFCVIPSEIDLLPMLSSFVVSLQGLFMSSAWHRLPV
jgi:hypothetical protein